MAVSKMPTGVTPAIGESTFKFPVVTPAPVSRVLPNIGRVWADFEVDAYNSPTMPTVKEIVSPVATKNTYVDRAADTAFTNDFAKKDAGGSAFGGPGGLPGDKLITIVPVSATPPVPSTSSASSSTPASSAATPAATQIKVATPDIITIDQETLPVELMTALIFESIGGQELINIARHDLITGGNLEYQPIKNMAIINSEYNSRNIIFMPDSSNEYSRNFTIDWDSHTIESFSDLDSTHIGIDSTKNELSLIVTNMKPGEQVEVQVLRSVTPYDYTKF